jgi:hypothetical protein
MALHDREAVWQIHESSDEKLIRVIRHLVRLACESPAGSVEEFLGLIGRRLAQDPSEPELLDLMRNIDYSHVASPAEFVDALRVLLLPEKGE